MLLSNPLQLRQQAGVRRTGMMPVYFFETCRQRLARDAR
jgi:hypothetical protein